MHQGRGNTQGVHLLRDQGEIWRGARLLENNNNTKGLP
ncbi:hypothetical protein T4D_4534 [Trichinella pseudospiralis]|uniref:Uncharacterized protein n=1 Tax=Trichinella pseudospiralis TaxID=6337 RepID=A0A0V1DQH3_TRIPS|nr:hypothetical protein T4D_4534 [Trichinella pseudospiralis]